MITLKTEKGFPLPLGAHLHRDGVNFALLSRHARQVRLLLFADDSSLPFQEIALNRHIHKTGDIWHIWVKGLKSGQLYGYKVDGEFAPVEGLRFNKHKCLLDPYARALTSQENMDLSAALGHDLKPPLRDLSFSQIDNTKSMPKNVFVHNHFNWGKDRFPNHAWSDVIIYETHVRGLSIHPSSTVKHPGTYRGVIEKIPHFKELGITTIELMPVQEFVVGEGDNVNPITGERLMNYWGYDPLVYFSPQYKYSSAREPGGQVNEFKTMVRELHKAGIEVILDVVLNHTAEGNELGPTLSFKGIDNSIYYVLDENKRYYKNYSGCGNTLNCNHPVVRDFIIDCLRYWVTQMHVDGFRFDLASVMGRDENGNILSNPPILERIAEDPILRNSRLIAEAWDAAGYYQVGSFPGKRWSEWNGRYRDDVRRFWRGDPGMLSAFAYRICGSADIYRREDKQPLNSINYLTCHDGMTLNDLVSYKRKHNEANGENNRDGAADDFSYNYGVEGETEDPQIEKIRVRQIKNMLATLFISRGVPMLLGGDEFRRTQQGNNNAYCQDNEISWYDWHFLKKNQEIHRFTKRMLAFRKQHKILTREIFYSGEDIFWFNDDGGPPDWSYFSRSFGCIIFAKDPKAANICLLCNAGFAEKRFLLPHEYRAKKWYVAVDTSKGTPDDIPGTGKNRVVVEKEYVLPERTLAIFLTR